MTIKRKMLIGLVFLSVVMIIQSAIMTYRINNIHNTTIELGRKIQPTLNKNYELKIAVIQIQQWLSDISATRGLDGLNDGIEVAEENFEHAKNILAELEELDEENAKTYQKMIPILEQYLKIGEKMANAYIESGPAGGNKIMPEFDAAAEAISTQVEEVMGMSVVHSTQSMNEKIEDTKALKLIVYAMATVMLLVIASLFFAINTVLLKPLNQMATMARDLAHGEGDLTKRLDQTRNDELGVTAKHINGFIEKTQTTIKSVGNVTEELTQKAGVLQHSSSATKQGMSVQHNETQQAASAITEMTASAKEIAIYTANAATGTDEVSSLADKSMQDSEKATTQISELVENMSSAQQVVQRLGNDSASIGSMLEVITSIFEQTNLLALNAAIEAARAGEQGRGFAVVADEVRSLAGRSQQSALEIQEIVDRLHKNVEEAINVIHAGGQFANDSLRSVELVKNSLGVIVKNAREVNDMNIQISTAAEEQSQVAVEVEQNIISISEATDSNTLDINEIHAIGVALRSSVQNLDSMINKFKY